MRDLRQGNDLAVIWSILRDGKPFNLSGKKLKLYLKNMYERREVEDFSARGNQIHWTFYGKDQKTTGKYSLILVANEDAEGMITTDTCDFVRLVSCSCKVENGIDSPNVEIETIELTSNLDYVAGTGGGGEGGGSYDDTAIWEALNDKVDKEEGKGLSSNDFTNTLKEKLEGLENYDDAEISSAVEKLSRDFNALLGDNASAAIESFNEIIAFLEGIEDSASLDAIVASIQQEIAKVSNGLADTDAKLTKLATEVGKKQATIEDLDSIRSGAGKGATAVQPSALSGYATTQQLTELSAEVSGLSEKIDDLPSGESSMFEAIFGETPFADLWNAYQSNKHVVVRSGKFILSVVRADETLISFSAINNENVYSATCNSSNVWTQGSVFNVEKATNKVTSLSDKSTNTQYPSAKAVYDFVNNTLGTIINGDY